MIYPKFLNSGDTIGICAPSAGVGKKINEFEKSLNTLKKEGYKIVNIDSNIICQRPKLSPYIDLMREAISIAGDLELNQVSIKAKTNESQDSMGAGLSIAVNAVVLLEKI